MSSDSRPPLEKVAGSMTSEWATMPIQDFARIGTGARDTQDRSASGGYPFFVRSQHVERIDSWSFDGEAVLTAGDGVGTGKVFHYVNGRFDYHQRVYRISHFSPEVDGRYFYYQFSRNFLARVESLTAKSSVDSVRMETIAGMAIAIPPIGEQVAIVRALDNTDDLITLLERMIVKKRAIKQGMMQQLLTGKTRLPGFSGKWHSAHLGTLGTLIKGRGIRRDDVRRSGVPCIRYGEIYTTYQGYTGTTVSFVDSSVADTALPIRAGDILFAGSGETREDIGLCVAYIGTKPAVAGGDIVVLRGTGFNPVFLSSALNTPIVANQKARLGQGDAVVHISSRALASIEVRVPTQAEQDAIAELIVDMDAELELLSRRLIKARAMKQGMMQELLTGRTRLPVREGVS